MAEDLRLPAELLDDGFFHCFFVDDNDKVRNFVVRINPPWILILASRRGGRCGICSMRRRESGRQRRSSGGGSNTSIGSRIKRGTLAPFLPIVSCRRLDSNYCSSNSGWKDKGTQKESPTTALAFLLPGVLHFLSGISPFLLQARQRSSFPAPAPEKSPPAPASSSPERPTASPSRKRSQVFPFGSVPLKTYLPDGDIDLTTIGYPNSEDALANEVWSVLDGEEQYKDAEFEVMDVLCVNAEVKLVTCLVENIVVDISFNQIGGLSTLCFLEKVDQKIGKDHLFKRSIILIKAWCFYESRILGAHQGLINAV